MIYLNEVSKQFGPKILFNKISFHLRPKERVGLIGANGTGKTTLLRIICNDEPYDSGSITIRKNAKVARLAQELETNDRSILHRVVWGDGVFADIRKNLDRLEQDSKLHEEEPEEWSRQYGNWQHKLEQLNGYDREIRAKSILSGLGFHDHHMEEPLSKFSGGWRMRVELAKLLLEDPDVLLLDEPTNHLDLKSVVWLEGFLKNFQGSLLLISHDRSFLNGLVHRIAELDRGTLNEYKGDYESYEILKKEREALLEAAASNQQRRIAEVERFIERFRAKNTKATQVQSRIKMLNKMERIETTSQAKTVGFRFPQPARCGRVVLELKNINKSYGDLKVYQNFSAQLERGFKVALVGENGAGKSTLLKLMAEVLPIDSGELVPGHNVTRAYYAQHHSESLDPDRSVLDTMEGVAGHLTLTQKRNILGSFLFSGDDVEKKVGVLSGGERSRLSLAKMLVSPSSLLLLDEPTNHLDIKSCEVLAAALADYEGTLVTISHDRFFLDGIINRVWEIDSGNLKEYVGNYSDYEWAKAREAEALEATANTSEKKKESSEKSDKDRKREEAELRNRKYKKLKPLQTELVSLENKLEQVMEEKQKVELILADQEIYQADNKQKLQETLEQQRSLSREEQTLMEQWEVVHTAIEDAQNAVQ